MKNLRLKNIDVGNCLTVKELRGFLAGKFDEPIVLKCGGKNFKLNEWDLVNGKLILYGKR